MPVMSSITLLLISVEKNRMRAMMAIAPMKAPARTDRNPERLNVPAVTLPPNSSMTKATPRLAPELIPRMEGPASGFLKAVCSMSPHTARAPPHSKAVSACGRRASHTMKLQLALLLSPPVRICHTSAGGMFTEPISRLAMNNSRMTPVKPIPYLQPLFISVFF